MPLWDKLKGELVDIIEWLDDSSNTMVWRFPRYENEIKYGAKLVVRQAQNAVFVNKGQVADVFSPGMHELKTDNMPILTTLMGWKYGFSSPFKAEVYFVSTRNFTDLKWGTKNPIILRDNEFGPVRLRAFGSFVVRVKDAKKLIEQVAGTEGLFTTEEITEQLKNLILTRFADLLGESKIPVLDLAANYNELSEFVQEKIAPEFLEYGIELTKFLTENISLPEAVEQALDKRSSMGVIGDLNKFSQFQTATAMEQAAQNPGGGASAGIGMGMGFGMANQMAHNYMQQQPGQGQGQGQTGGPPPLPGGPAQFYVGEGGQQKGPFDMNTLTNMIQNKTLSKDTLVWKQGMPAWAAAGQVQELQQIFGAAPPPLPPQS